MRAARSARRRSAAEPAGCCCQPVGAITFYFDPVAAIKRAAPLAAAVDRATDLEQAHEILTGLGIRTELQYERDNAPATPA